MNVTLRAVRVYGSASRYGSQPQLDPLGGPITLEDYPRLENGPRHRALVFLGAPVEPIMQATRVRMAVGHVLMNWLQGEPLPTDADAAIEFALQQVDAPSQWAWYITIVIDREVEIEDRLINSNKYIWLEGEYVYRLEDEFAAFATPYIDRIATYIATVIDPWFLHQTAIKDRVFFTAPEHITFGLPRGTGTVEFEVVRTVESLDLSKLGRRLHASTTLTEQKQEWLDDLKGWYLAALGEDDTWKQFFWFYLCIEILSGQLAPQFYDQVMTQIGMRSGDPCPPNSTPLVDALCNSKKVIAPRGDMLGKGRFLRGKFAIVTLALFPHTADAEFAEFEKLKDVRDSLAHGESLQARDLPAATARTLVQRYLNAVVAYQLGG